MTFGALPISSYYVDNITIAIPGKDKYGDETITSQVDEKARILEHHEIFDNTERDETIRTDAVSHHPPSSTVTEDAIIKHDTDYYRVVKFIRAKRGKRTDIEFKKCYLEKFHQVTDIS